ncbi:MAG: XRE family transcriptional regulator [Acidobacteriaceae bacterium]|nr:XRE family transcriptional regulator [Acidobacteriaceae bacterium]MBV9037058.1 XRE family transcriptional regulator [Acidobacteriaceae bacterium]
MAKKFQELEAKMSPQARARGEARYRELLKEMPLQELRHARELTQAQIAESMHMTQAAVSKLERNTDMYISTLKHFVEAMGGELDIRAVFPEGEIRIKQFQTLSAPTASVERDRSLI